MTAPDRPLARTGRRPQPSPEGEASAPLAQNPRSRGPLQRHVLGNGGAARSAAPPTHNAKILGFPTS
eukprot:15464413-Alexandrium_andersonii.AAC.1